MKKSIILLVFMALSMPVFSQADKASSPRLELIHQYLNTQEGLSGMVMLGMDGKIIYNQGFGYADRVQKKAFSDRTIYTIGSITKPFTATAILLLMERGQLKPEDPITKYFDGVPADKAKITLHQLMTHSSGLPPYIGDDYAEISMLQFQQKVWEQPLLFAPGSGYEYSNVGYSLLGMIVEKLSGKTYSEFLADNIFKPAGMTTAGYSNPSADDYNLAHGYHRDGSDWGTSRQKKWDGKEPYWNLKANGGLLMSARDMYQWYLALRDSKVLQPKTLALQTYPHVDEGQGRSFYGYGYAVDPKGEVVEHNGGNMVFSADFRWFPRADMFIFSASNDANVRLFRIMDDIIYIMMTGELPVIETWNPIALPFSQEDKNQVAANAFAELIRHYSKEKADHFLTHYCSAGIVERNGKDRMLEIFEMLQEDTGQQPLLGMFANGNKIQLVFPAADKQAKLKIELDFLDHKIDKMMAELEGM